MLGSPLRSGAGIRGRGEMQSVDFLLSKHVWFRSPILRHLQSAWKYLLKTETSKQEFSTVLESKTRLSQKDSCGRTSAAVFHDFHFFEHGKCGPFWPQGLVRRPNKAHLPALEMTSELKSAKRRITNFIRYFFFFGILKKLSKFTPIFILRSQLPCFSDFFQ